MPDATDNALIQAFASDGSETAFAELVQRHINLVYSVAWRCTGNAHDAQDVTQAVFIVLAQKAPGLRQHTALTGWLYETTRLTSARLVRTRVRQQVREHEAYMQSTSNPPDSEELWRRVAPFLEDAMGRLGAHERALLALRYFENKTAAEAAAALGIQEWAAHKRTSRALEKLRRFFERHGIDSTAATLAGAISANSIQAAPVGLAASTRAVAMAKGAAIGASSLTLAKGTLKIMAWSTGKTATAIIVIAALAMLSMKQHQAQSALREQNDALAGQVARLRTENEELARKRPRLMRLPAPPVSFAGSGNSAAAEAPEPTNLFVRITHKSPVLTHEQIDPYLKANGRNAASLLAAFRTSGDSALLKEAMQKYPNDPQVAFEAAFAKDLSPEEKRQWLTTFEKSAPGNALANYLSAADYFASDHADLAAQEFAAAAGKPLQDYTIDRVEGDVEAYLAAGYSVADAKTMASMQLLLPQLGQMKELGLQTIDLAKAYQQNGDPASAQAALQMAVNLGQQYANSTPGESEISQLVGLAIEKAALGAMDPNAPFGDGGQTVQDQLNQLAQQKAELTGLDQKIEPLLPSLTDQDWIIYKDRWLMFGEQNAEQWVLNKYGGK